MVPSRSSCTAPREFYLGLTLGKMAGRDISLSPDRKQGLHAARAYTLPEILFLLEICFNFQKYGQAFISV
ncbi:hypothetical protein V6N13_105849 [Hibiscus sabdariffa]